MGEIAEMMLDGTMCEVCGEWMDDVLECNDVFTPPGHPRRCAGCGPLGAQAAAEDEPPPPRRRRRRGRR